MDRLSSSAEDLQEALPEYRGMTIFGSTVRGVATEYSDADIFVFLAVDPGAKIQQGTDQSQLVERIETGALKGAHIFRLAVAHEYEALINSDLHTHGIDSADIFTTPISEHIISQEVAEALQGAGEWDHTKQGEAVAPRNIRGLFHMSVDDTLLKPYRKQVLETYAQSPHGETAWKMLRHMTAYFEVGREGEADLPQVSHRELPSTLQEAIEYYR